MRRILFFSAALVLLFAFGIGLTAINVPTISAQSEATPTESLAGTSFEIVQEIGLAIPQRIIYDPVFERYAIIDAYNRLLLVDAATYQTQHQLYERGGYNDFAFSHDGRWLALAIETRIELWDSNAGTLVSSITDLSQARRIHGPMTFADDDNLLLFNGTYPAPQALRRTENDTTNVPWLWNLTAARNEGDSTFPGGVEALPFYDYRNGFVLGPENRIVAALPGRLQVLDAYSTEVLYDIDTARYEQDPLRVWFSARDNQIYVRPVEESSLIQVDTRRGVLVEFPLNSIEGLTLNDLETIGSVELSEQAVVIGQPDDPFSNPLLRVLLGEEYQRDFRWARHPLTVTLIDLLQPSSGDELQLRALMFVFDERTERGWFVMSNPYAVTQITLSPDAQDIMLRRYVDEEFIEIYNLDTGNRLLDVIPALRDLPSYSPSRKNRVLRYTTDGSQFISDFQRFDVATGDTLAEDLRYSRRFERFFWQPNEEGIVTLSGTEWRLWSVATGELIRREVLPLNGEIVATSSDGFSYLTRTYNNVSGQTGMETYDVGTGERQNVLFQDLQGRFIEDILPSVDWQHFLVIYSVNEWGAYAPGNEIALYSLANGPVWFFAGDDLPEPDSRSYGWVDNERVYVNGARSLTGEFIQPPRELIAAMPPLDSLTPDALPACFSEVYTPEQQSTLMLYWPLLFEFAPRDEISYTVGAACTSRADSVYRSIVSAFEQIPSQEGPAPTATLSAEYINGVPACLLTRYPDRVDTLAGDWARLTAELPSDLEVTLAGLMCRGLADLPARQTESFGLQTMMIDTNTGERFEGRFASNPVIRRPIEPILDEFYRTEERSMGTALLSPSEQYVAASSQPGELIVYRILRPYQTLLDQITATAIAVIATENRIAVLPSATPTLSMIGTANPTLTPTISPTPPPRPETLVDQPQLNDVQDFCPSETLYSIDAPPENYSPVGRIVGPVQGDELWAIEPESGRRFPDETIPTCGFGLGCELSPDNQWVLAISETDGYVVFRPDGTSWRVLFDPEKPWEWPEDIWWSSGSTIEYEVYLPLPDDPHTEVWMLQRDILGVYPDPAPFYPRFLIEGAQAELIERQPGGPLAVARTTFSTGVNPGYRYFIYNTDTGEIVSYFARLTEYPEDGLYIRWHPLGDRLYYFYPTPFDQPIIWYQYDTVRNVHERLGDFGSGGEWSNEGRYQVYSTSSRTQPVAVWDSQSGLTRTYCIPETGARLYNGAFYWSPDSRYVALQLGLPADENDEDIGQHVLVLDVATGSVTDLTYGGGPLFMWAQEPGTYTAVAAEPTPEAAS